MVPARPLTWDMAVRLSLWCDGRAQRHHALEGTTAMAKVISTLFISADGVAEIDPDWHFPYFDENMGRAVGEDYETSDVLLIGRVTYDSFAGAWPDREAAGGEDAPFAKQLGDVRKVVVSRQPLEFSWRNSELIEGDLVEAVTALKADAGIRRHPHPRLDLRGAATARRGAGRRAPPAGAPGGGTQGPQALRRRRRAVPPERDGDGGRSRRA